MSQLNNWRLAAGSPPPSRGGILEEWIGVYNNTGNDILNGAIKVLGYYVETTPSVFAGSAVATPGLIGVPLAPATQATVNVIGVIDNTSDPVAGTPVTTYAGIKNADTGWMKTKGVCQGLVNGNTPVALGDTLKATNAGTALIKDVAATSGASGIPGILSCAVCMEAYAVNADALKWIYLPGFRAGI